MAEFARHVLSLPIEPSVRSKLISNGFCVVEDFRNFTSIKKLRSAISITEKEATDVLDVSCMSQ